MSDIANSASGATFVTRAHAKVNLQLGVADARPDGFHELASVFQALALHDTVTLRLDDDYSPAGSASAVATLAASGAYAAGVPEDATNLAWRAVDSVVAALRDAHGERAVPAAHLTLEKGIPAAGGMAGGSADAAAALRLADVAYAPLFGVETLGEDALSGIAARLGSDVPFTLMCGTALGTGRGEKLAPMLSRGTFTWAIITNAQGLSTPAVFGKLDELRAAERGTSAHMDTSAVAQAVAAGDATALAAAMVNDLEPAALSLRPDLRKILATGEAAGALRGIVSGSGPTCAFLCADAETAAEVVAQVTADNRGTRGLITTSPQAAAPIERR